MKLKHSETCSSVFLRSVYDKTCPRCSITGKVILLRRKTIVNGCSPQESASAKAIADKLIVQHGLVGAEIVDRLYTSVTNKIVRKARTKHEPLYHTNDAAEGME